MLALTLSPDRYREERGCLLFLFFCLLFMFGPRAYRGDDESVGVCFFGEGRRVAPVYMGAWGRSPHMKIVFPSPRSGEGAEPLKAKAGGARRSERWFYASQRNHLGGELAFLPHLTSLRKRLLQRKITSTGEEA